MPPKSRNIQVKDDRPNGAQQEAVDLVQSYINTLERRIEAAKNALENGNQTWLALDILNGKRGY